MFEFFKKFVNGVVRMVNRATIKNVLGEYPEMSQVMFDKVKQWNDMLNGSAPWCDNYVKSMKVEHGICREFADVVLSEMDVNISNETLMKKFEKCTEDLNENLQDGLALGSFCIKPVGNGEAEYITANNFVVLSFGLDKKPDDIVFFDVRKVEDKKTYIRFERHSIKSGELVISNTAIESNGENSVTRIVPLTVLDEWAELPEEIVYPGMKSLDLGYYRNPIKNRIDDSYCGISIFDDAIDVIKRIDIQGARLDWEFESGERAIHVDSAALKKKPNGQNGLARLNKRLYRGLDIDSEGKELLKEYSPDFRDENIINGLETLYRQLEFIVGLAYGDLSDPDTVEKTAEEVKTSKNRKYNRVNAIQEKLRICLEDFVIGLAFHEGLMTTGYEFTCNFTDSILTDEKSERQQDKEDVAMGVMSILEYRMKWYGEDEATAKKNLPEQNTVME